MSNSDDIKEARRLVQSDEDSCLRAGIIVEHLDSFPEIGALSSEAYKKVIEIAADFYAYGYMQRLRKEIGG